LAEFEGHSIEIPVGSVVPSALIVMMRHTLRGRFLVTLYREQWEKLLGMAEENDGALKNKE
jgi:hypothetical protein